MIDREAIIIDNGTNTIKAGFSGDEMPKIEVRTVLGFPTSQGGDDKKVEKNSEQIDIFVGEEALSKGGILKLEYPIKGGVINDYETMEKLWKHIFYNELLADTKSQPIILTESPFAEYYNKREMAECIFEKLNSDEVYIANSSVLSLYANGRTTGMVVDVGYQKSSCVPVYEGFILHHAIQKIDLGGSQLTNYLCKLINNSSENTVQFVNPAEISMINELKEKICLVADDYDSSMKKTMDDKEYNTYKLPDGTNVYIRGEKFQCPELLFAPSLNNLDMAGLHEQAFKSITSCDEDINKELFLNVVLCGGSSLFLKIQNRFQKELQSLAPTGKNVNVIAPPERKYSAWLGGAILASLKDFKETMFISRKEWNDNGPDYIFNKFF